MLKKVPCRFILLCYIISIALCSCEKKEDLHKPTLFLKSGTLYTKDGSLIKLGGTVNIGILASGAGAPLTYLRIERITGSDTLVQVDKGIFKESEGLDEDFTFSKDTASVEVWRIVVMNADRETADAILKIGRAPGSEWKPVKFFENIELSLQNNQSKNWYLDLESGVLYNNETVAGNESSVDVIGYFYYTSGVPSPTLTCPGYSSIIAYYPSLSNWQLKNTTLYDYVSTDNDLVSANAFDQAFNDSILVNSYKPDKVSGNCKFCYTGKIIPFKTCNGKYGLIKVISAAENDEGVIKLSVKIQE